MFYGKDILVIKKEIAIVSYSDGSKDPRILKQICGLKEYANLTFIGFNEPRPEDAIKFIKVEQPIIIKKKPVKKLLSLIISVVTPSVSFLNHPLHLALGHILKENIFDLILVSDMAMPVCVKYRNNAKVVFDAHEYYLDAVSSIKFRLTTKRLLKVVIRKYSKYLSGFITVSNGLVNLYKDYYEHPEIIYNSIWYSNLNPKLINTDTNKKIKLIHHGGAWYKRKIEDLIYMVSLLDDRFEMDLMLIIKSEEYREFLISKIKKYNVPVRLIDPVPIFEVSKKLNEYDIGVHRIDGNISNHKFAMPNKIFEFVQGRLALVTSPNPDMKEFIESNNIGVVSKDYSIESMAAALNSLSIESINEYKKNSDKAANIFNAEAAQKQYLNIVKESLKNE